MKNLILLSLTVAVCNGGLISNDSSFYTDIVDSTATFATLATASSAIFHGAGVYIPPNFWFTTNFLGNSSVPRYIDTYTYNVNTSVVTRANLDPGFLMTGGASPRSGNQIIFVSQGQGNIAGSLQLVNTDTQVSTPLGLKPELNLNSPNDVYVSSVRNGIFFTDPIYGYLYNYGRTGPIGLPNSIYYVDLATLHLTDLYDFANSSRPNGIVLSPNGTVLYVADSGYIVGPPNTRDNSVSRSIYAFDFFFDTNGVPTVANKRTFVQNVDNGVPDTLRTDELGNVYAAVQDGVAVYNPSGTYLGKFQVPSQTNSISSFGWVGKSLYILADYKLYSVDLKVGAGPLANTGSNL